MRGVDQQLSHLSYWEKRQQQACPLCEGVGFRMVVKQGETRAMKCRCLTRERVRSLLAQSSIPAAYQNGSLEDFTPRSLEEVSLVDSLRDILNERDPASALCWIVPGGTLNSQKIVAWFASDLVRFQGYSCLWLDRMSLNSSPNSSGQHSSPRIELALSTDFLFVEMESGRQGLFENRPRQILESCLKERLHRKRSVFLLGNAPDSLEESQHLFSDERLASAVIRDFQVIDPAKTSSRARNSRWLF